MQCLRKSMEVDNKAMRYGIEESMVHTKWKQVVAPESPDSIYVEEGLLTLPSWAHGR